MEGVLKTLVQMLAAAPTLLNASVSFGEENVTAEEYVLGYVTIAPVGGPFKDQGYVEDLNPATEMVWAIDEQIDITLWSAVDANATTIPQPVDHATAVETLRAGVMAALQFQRAPGGLFYKPIRGRWLWFNNAQNRYGRAYVLTVQVEIPITTPLYPEARIRDTSVTPSIEEN